MSSSQTVVKSICTVLCQVSDMDRAVAFYRDVLGLTPGHVTPYWSDFQVGSVRLGLHPPFQGSEPPYSSPGKGWIVGIDVDDIRALKAQLVANSTEIAGDFHDVPGGVILDFRDPEGNNLQAVEYGTRTADFVD